jgi:ABC-2 type transport system ATP-binding protein
VNIGRSTDDQNSKVGYAAPDMSQDAIKVLGAIKRFGSTTAVNGLDLEIARGTFYGLLGPNGAGKSTTVGMLTGTLRPTAGRIELLGKKLDPDDPWFKARMGVVAEEAALFSRLRGHEQLVFSGMMYGLAREEAARRALALLGLVNLERDADTLIADYSRGMRKKLAIACALIHSPGLLFFDEPFEGVDAMSAETIRRVLSGLCERGATVLLTTHILEVAEKLVTQVGIIDHGKLVYQADMLQLKSDGESLSNVFNRVVGYEGDTRELPDWLGGGRASD